MSGAVELEAAKVAARKAIYADGRGMIGAERNYLEYRVARAILSESARANAAEAELATLRADNERLGRERDEWRDAAFLSDCEAYSGLPMEDALTRVEAAEAERDTLLAQVEALKVDLENRAEWHRCSCPEPCDDYGVFPGGCAGRYREDYRALIARAALTKEPS